MFYAYLAFPTTWCFCWICLGVLDLPKIYSTDFRISAHVKSNNLVYFTFL